jgi:O-antigen ligase
MDESPDNMRISVAHLWTNRLAVSAATVVALVALAILSVAIHPALLAIGIVCVGMAGLFLTFPYLTLLGLLLLRSGVDGLARHYRILEGTEVSVNLLGLLNIAVIILALFQFLVMRRKLPRYPFVGPYVIFLYVILLSSLYSVNKVISLRGWTTVASYLAIYVLTLSHLTDMHRVSRLRAALAISTLVPISVALHQFVTGTGNTVSSPGLNRVTGTYFHPSAFGMYLVVLWPLLLHQSRYARGMGGRLLYGMLLALATFSIGLTYTRIVWLALILSATGTLLLLRRWKFALLLGVTSTAVMFLFTVPILTRFSEAFQLEGGRLVWSASGSMMWRFEQWRTALTLLIRQPLLGVGWWSFPEYNRWQTTPHNDYVRIAAEAGFLGLVSFLFLALSLLVWFWRGSQRRSLRNSESQLVGMVLVSTCNYLLLALTDNPLGLPEVSWYLWALVAIGVATVRHSHMSSSRESTG